MPREAHDVTGRGSGARGGGAGPSTWTASWSGSHPPWTLLRSGNGKLRAPACLPAPLEGRGP